MRSVDVVILSWDRTDDTIAAIGSARAQTGVDLHIHVVDQGTNPADLRRLTAHCEPLENVHVALNRKNAGVAGGRNQASAMGSGEFIVALDNDAVFSDPTCCARAAEIMADDLSLGALAFRINVFDSPLDAPLTDRSSWSYGRRDPEDWAGRCFFAKQFVGAGHMLRRSAFDEVGGYDARFFFMHEEVDLCDRLANAGYRIAYRSDVAIRHKVSAEHRVHWKSGRFQMHLRNMIYLKFKQQGLAFDVFAELLVQTVGGLRIGFVDGALRGFFGALRLAPAALRERRGNPYVKRTEAGSRYLAEADRDLGAAAAARKPWDGANALWRLYCRLRWETDFSRDFGIARKARGS